MVAHDLAADMDSPQLVYRDENIRVLALTNTHYHFPLGSEDQRFARSYSYRIETAHRVFVFTGDTGVSAHVEALAQGADVLVSEVIDLLSMERMLNKIPSFSQAQRDGLMRHMQLDHLTPIQVGKLAKRADVKEIVLTHLSPGNDGETDLSGYTRGIETNFKGPVHVAHDLDRW